MLKLRLKWGLWLLLVAPLAGLAESGGVWSGFLTQGLTYTSDNNFFGESDDGISTDFSEAGLNYSNSFNSLWRFSGQATYRNSNALDDHEFSVDFLQLGYVPVRTGRLTAGVNVGRLKISPGLYGGVIDVAAAWPSALLSEALYPNRFRTVMTHIDGIGLTLQSRLGDWTLAQELIYGRIVLPGSVVEDTWFRGFGETNDPQVDDVVYLRTELTSPDGSLQLGMVLADFDWSVEAEASVGKFTVDVDHRVWFLFASKQWGDWQLDVEVSRYDADISRIRSRLNGSCDAACLAQIAAGLENIGKPTVSDYRYASLYYSFASGLTVYAGAGLNVEDVDDPRGRVYARTSGGVDHSRYVKQAYAGARYDIDAHWSVAGVFSYFEGSRNVMGVLNPDQAAIEKYWNAVHVNVSYRF